MDSLHPRLRTHVPTGVRLSVEALPSDTKHPFHEKSSGFVDAMIDGTEEHADAGSSRS